MAWAQASQLLTVGPERKVPIVPMLTLGPLKRIPSFCPFSSFVIPFALTKFLYYEIRTKFWPEIGPCRLHFSTVHGQPVQL